MIIYLQILLVVLKEILKVKLEEMLLIIKNQLKHKLIKLKNKTQYLILEQTTLKPKTKTRKYKNVKRNVWRCVQVRNNSKT